MQPNRTKPDRRIVGALAFGAAACFLIAAAIELFAAKMSLAAPIGLGAAGLLWIVVGFVWLKQRGR